ncbi:MAG: metallophosphoesterase [Myxococcales bacterium]|nr:metallophosphoesterase [Myxococcales bacterium]
MPRSEVFNFLWVRPSSTIRYDNVAAQQDTGQVRHQRPGVNAIILYPSLMTPLVFVPAHDGQWLELLLATDGPLTPDQVNAQLKISRGLDASKAYAVGNLFGGHHSQVIQVEPVSADGNGILRTHERFEGRLHQKAKDLLQQMSLTSGYRVRISASCLERAVDPSQLEAASTSRPLSGEGGSVTVSVDNLGTELQDGAVRELLRRHRGGADNPIPAYGRCTFAAPRRAPFGVDISRVDLQDPIQSYHPVFVFRTPFDYANMAHVSDIHINSRLDIVGQSNARVIEYPEGEHLGESPPISELLMGPNGNFASVLQRIVSSRAHLLLVGGDLIDHVHNAYSRATNLGIKGIWDAVDMSDTGYTNATYPKGVDFMAFFSMLVRLGRAGLPVFGVPGNHDVYDEAFGISPRFSISRTNANPPADVNLTFYEALLAFGPTWHVIKKSFNFTPELFDWFYTLFTPFEDFWVKLPKQSLVALGWGRTEDMVALGGASGDFFTDVVAPGPGGQGFGHLPRSDDAVTSDQLVLLRAAADDTERKLIVASHFTVLSYAEDIKLATEFNSHGGAPGVLDRREWTHYTMGTFESHRPEVFDMLAQRKIQCFITGHSHRRAVYFLSDAKKSWRWTWSGGLLNSDNRLVYAYLPEHFDFARPPQELKREELEPAIVVSDSAGPYPRHNLGGEFYGYGSDYPAGSLVIFGADGKIAEIERMRASGRGKPRIPVQMEFLDTEGDGVFEIRGKTDAEVFTAWSSRSVGARSKYSWQVKLVEHLRDELHISIAELVLAGAPQNYATIRIPLTRRTREVSGFFSSETQEMWDVPADHEAEMDQLIESCPQCFMSIRFTTTNRYLQSQYDWNAWWNYEVVFSRRTSGGQYSMSIYYEITRPTREVPSEYRRWYLPDGNWPEVPNFAWRRDHLLKYRQRTR